jgi:hypothetical protein
MQKYFKLSDRLTQVEYISKVGNNDVVKTGMVALDDLVGFKKGYPVFIGGAPYAGKTEVGLEWLMNLAITQKYKSFVYCGEGGTVDFVFLELMHKYIGKPFSFMDEKERLKAQYFIDEHFVIANDDCDFTIVNFYDSVKEAEIKFGVKFDCTFFDPFNDVKEELEKFNNREDKFLAYALKEVRKSSKANKRIDFVVTHIADIKAVTDKNGNRYIPPALPSEWAGGRTWWRRAFLMILVYRPSKFIADENGKPYEENETIIFVQKAKPKGIAKIGKASIFFDWKRNQYYSKVYDFKVYSCEQQPEMNDLVPNQNFYETDKNENPF